MVQILAELPNALPVIQIDPPSDVPSSECSSCIGSIDGNSRTEDVSFGRSNMVGGSNSDYSVNVKANSLRIGKRQMNIRQQGRKHAAKRDRW